MGEIIDKYKRKLYKIYAGRKRDMKSQWIMDAHHVKELENNMLMQLTILNRKELMKLSTIEAEMHGTEQEVRSKWEKKARETDAAVRLRGALARYFSS